MRRAISASDGRDVEVLSFAVDGVPRAGEERTREAESQLDGCERVPVGLAESVASKLLHTSASTESSDGLRNSEGAKQVPHVMSLIRSPHIRQVAGKMARMRKILISGPFGRIRTGTRSPFVTFEMMRAILSSYLASDNPERRTTSPGLGSYMPSARGGEGTTPGSSGTSVGVSRTWLGAGRLSFSKRSDERVAMFFEYKSLNEALRPPQGRFEVGLRNKIAAELRHLLGEFTFDT